MFENYIATKEDLLAVEEGIFYVYKPELDFIFKNKNKIDKTFIISFDSKEIFIWEKVKNKWCMEKYPHQGLITDTMQRGWSAGYEERIKSLVAYLPKKITEKHWLYQSTICGSLITPFIEIQKNSNRKLNPYTTKESYLATIVHEFGHIYFDNHTYTRSFYWDKNENINYINKAAEVIKGIESNLENIRLRISSKNNLTELFAFCTDFSASKIFFKQHHNDILNELSHSLLEFLKIETGLDMTKQDSVLKDPHTFAAVLGPILVKKYGDRWVEKLLKGNYL